MEIIELKNTVKIKTKKLLHGLNSGIGINREEKSVNLKNEQ